MNTVHAPVPGAPRRQQGVALVVSLIILLILTVITVTAMRSSIFELQMSRNEQARVEAFERAQSIIDAVIAVVANMPVTSGYGYCLASNTTSTIIDSNTGNAKDCQDDAVSFPSGLTSTEKDALMKDAVAIVERTAPEFVTAPRVVGSSAAVFQGAQFAVEARYDGTASKQGRVDLVQGVMVLVSTGQQ
jgi:Tfp pilus assembly protein PilX